MLTTGRDISGRTFLTYILGGVVSKRGEDRVIIFKNRAGILEEWAFVIEGGYVGIITKSIKK